MRNVSEPCDLDAVAARGLIASKQLSTSELLESCIRRITAINPAVNAIVATDHERARKTAKETDAHVAHGEALGALAGLPIGIKDLQETAGIATTFGSPLFRSHVPSADEGLVRRIREAGGIVLGKTNTPEFGAGANTRNSVYGATGNPFDPSKSSAGSSGGSAVALATGMVPLATGSDMGGSLRNPAAFSGIVGFRPTPGLVPNERHLLGWSPLPVSGPMARTVGDLALLLSVMASDDAGDPLASTIPGRRLRKAERIFPVQAADLSRLRVALTPDFGFALVERGITQAFAEKTSIFRHVFAKADDATPDCTGADRAFAVLRAVQFLAGHLGKVRNQRAEVGPNVIANVEEGLRYSAADVAEAEVLQTALYHRWQTFFRDYDLLLTPAMAITPRAWRELFPKAIDGKKTASYYHWLAPAYAVTLAGHPALSLPVGLDDFGMPFGLQIVGRRGGDMQVLAAAAALEKLLAEDPRTARAKPDIKRLEAARPISESAGFLGFN